jgi:hypothetical protein
VTRQFEIRSLFTDFDHDDSSFLDYRLSDPLTISKWRVFSIFWPNESRLIMEPSPQ